ANGGAAVWPGFPRRRIALTRLVGGGLFDESEREAVPPGDWEEFVEESGGEDDWQMGTTVEADGDLFATDGNIGGHVDEVAEDLAGLGIGVAAHAVRHGAIEAAGEDEEGHVEVDFEADG